MTGKWDQHTKEQFGQEVVGDQVACMEVLGYANAEQGKTIDLGCSECQTQFTAELWKGGDCTVIRKSDDDQTDELHVQCPGCGCEWSGHHRRFYGLGIAQKSPNGRLMGIGYFNSIEAASPIEAAKLTLERGLIPKEIGENPSFKGFQIDEISWNNHRLLQIRKRVHEATIAQDPNLPSIQAKATFEEADLLRGRQRRQSMGKQYNMPTVHDIIDMVMQGRQMGQNLQKQGEAVTSDKGQPAYAGATAD